MLNISKNNGMAGFDFLCGASHNWLMNERLRIDEGVRLKFNAGEKNRRNDIGEVSPAAQRQRDQYCYCLQFLFEQYQNRFIQLFNSEVFRRRSKDSVIPGNGAKDPFCFT